MAKSILNFDPIGINFGGSTSSSSRTCVNERYKNQIQNQVARRAQESKYHNKNQRRAHKRLKIL